MLGIMCSKESVRQLIEKAQEGDRGAFEKLVSAYHRPLQSFIEFRLGSHLKQALDQHDVLQETLLKAYESIAQFRRGDDKSFLRWLRAIAEHVILAAARKQRREHQVRLTTDVAEDESSPSKALQRDERFDRLQDAMTSLSPEHREVIMLARIQELSIVEIAERMDRTPNAVSHLLLRALRKLKSSFGDTESLHLPPRRLTHGDTEHGEA